ncbi:MAG: hypothetical protein LBL23_04235 [Coriobacteriales bacterium]|nr:hypothetical protein [Coriobacteriales bacterium]
MLRNYLITDDAGVDFGTLSYAPETAAWHLEINPERNWEDTPLSLALYIQQGTYNLDERQSLAWVRDRLVPPNRQNINQILASLGIEEYDEFALLQHTQGRSPHDKLHLEEQV